MLQNKFNLTQKENVFLAKKTLVENIYYSAKLEGVNVTFPQTKTILDGVSVGGLSMDDVQVILNLRDAWRYMLEYVQEPFTLESACKVNEFVSRNESLEWGVLRYGRVDITGTDYIPPIPVEEDEKQVIDEIMGLPTITDQAITYYLWAMRSQLFWDGNKRTSNICANKMLICEGKGIITIKEEHLQEFNTLLTDFYNTNQMERIKTFLYDKCLFGLEF